MKFAVPTATAVAPAASSSIASSGSAMPPMPMMGMSTAADASQTSFTATGWMAGPESPPVTFASTGRRASMSIAIAGSVLQTLSASDPASAAAFAKTRMSGTFGASLVMSVSEVAARTAATTEAIRSGFVPNDAPPRFTFGQETLSSSASTPATPSSMAAASAYASTVVPQMLTIAGTPFSRK